MDRFDLFPALETISSRKLDWYEKLGSEAKKGVAPFVLARWLAGTSDGAQIVRINTVVNPYLFSMGSEKGLLSALLAAACTGRSRRYYWLKAPGKGDQRLRVEVIKEHFGCSSREAQSYSTLDGDDIIAMAEDLGWDKEQLTKLKAEVKDDGTRSTTSKSSRKKG